jgi:tRNA nucleotidyltransferase (CCA-adding enzyme)
MGKIIQKKFEDILKKISPSKEELKEINEKLKKFLRVIKKEIKNKKINVEIFIGGSFAKGTQIRKKVYDIDIFFRFSKNHKNISAITENLLKNFKNVTKVHGSRDYFRVQIEKNLFFEIVPVLKIKKPNQADNITDLSYSHVKYIKKKIKNKRILDEIQLAKAFCYSTKTYGAESHIRGFSGYSLELLIIYYKNFLNFLKEICKNKDEKIIIDIEKIYKNKPQVLRELNESKLGSPIILIDPTHKYRNALAALSYETFKKFKEEARKFLKNPSEKFFEVKEKNFDNIKRKYKRYDGVVVEIKTNKQEGAIAGSKLLKFFNYLNCKISKYFEIKEKNFEYNGDNSAKGIFVAKSKEKILISGPYLNDKKNVKKFKENHKNIYIKKNRVYCEEKINFNLKEFLNNLKKKDKKIIKEMGISGIEVN